MSRWTKKELESLGFAEQQAGNWAPRVRGGDPGEVPKPKRPSVRRSHRQAEAKKVPQADSSRGHRFRLEVVARCRRNRDPDNLVPKYFIDELRRAGVIPDDTSTHIERVELSIEVIQDGQEETIIRVWEVG